MDFATMLGSLLDGRRMTRQSWEPGSYIELEPAKPELKRLPFVFMRTSGGNFIPWTITQLDLWATDWQIWAN